MCLIHYELTNKQTNKQRGNTNNERIKQESDESYIELFVDGCLSIVYEIFSSTEFFFYK